MDATNYPAHPIDPRIVPPPPRLHWGWVLVLTILTRGYFNSIWLIVQANWIKKMTGRTEGFWWSIVNVCVLPSVIVLALLVGFTMAFANHGDARKDSGSLGLVVGAVTVALILGVYLKTVFTMRGELESMPIGIPLGGAMTFLFSAMYFQYFLRDYVVPDAAEVFGPLVPPPAYVPPTSPRELM